ncbi:hypothetical protein ACSMX9_19485 [Streptomyces sp. LE64]|uniref:hypothetical protein n=1 Tax=Streptomyces sp. LE64 TaxID=3448653 RepID=UPI0040430FFF
MTEATLDSFSEHVPDLAADLVGIEQGDVLEFLSSEKFPDGWDAVVGVVVTANCDLALGKHWGMITYVPAIPVDSYVRGFIAPKYLKAEAAKSERQIAEILRASSGEAAFDRALSMIDLGYSQDDLNLLLGDSPAPKTKLRFEKECLSLRESSGTFERLAKSERSEDFWSVILSHMNAIDAHQSLSAGASIDKFKKSIKSSLKSLPGDVFYLSAPSPLHRTGYVVVLRFIRSIEESAVALRSVDEIRNRTQYRARRVARLDTLYSHRVVQQMASVFTDIGLPNEYEQARDGRFDGYIEKLGDAE